MASLRLSLLLAAMAAIARSAPTGFDQPVTGSSVVVTSHVGAVVTLQEYLASTLSQTAPLQAYDVPSCPGTTAQYMVRWEVAGRVAASRAASRASRAAAECAHPRRCVMRMLAPQPIHNIHTTPTPMFYTELRQRGAGWLQRRLLLRHHNRRHSLCAPSVVEWDCEHAPQL